MGFSYEMRSWDSVINGDGVMFMGWGGIAPGLYTAIAIGLCIYVLWSGNRQEHERYDGHK